MKLAEDCNDSILDIIQKLENFEKVLSTYRYLQNRRLQNRRRDDVRLSSDELIVLSRLQANLPREVGKYKSLICELTEKEGNFSVQDSSGRNLEFDAWTKALDSDCDELSIIAIEQCIIMVGVAIGTVQNGIESGIRDRYTGSLKTEFSNSTLNRPKVFIAHGGKSEALNKLREFISALNMQPIIVELMPTETMSVDDKVNKYTKEADCGIVLATNGGIIDTKSAKKHPRPNVIDELERLRAAFPSKVILLVEKGVDLPSNIAGLTYESFTRQSMDRAFTAIVRELVAFGLLKAVKPSKSEE